MPEYKVVDFDDWVVLYKDGVSIHQGHDIPDFVWAKELGATIEYASDDEKIMNAYDEGQVTIFPQTLGEWEDQKAAIHEV